MATLVGSAMFSSCNKDSDSTVYNAPVNLAVTAFSLSEDSDNPGLDSVYFSIDLEHGVIFNADSLRKGTRIDKVVPKITFSSEISEAVIVMSGGTTREGEVDYRTNPTDSIDFTGNVTLRVKAADGLIGTTYRIKVNVHEMDPDTLMWDNIDYMGLSTRLPRPKEMKTIQTASKVVSLIKESDDSYSMSTPVSLQEYKWEVKALTLPFTPNVQSLTAAGDNVWILDDAGNLWKGDPTLATWSATAEKWTSMIGSYKETAIGLKESASGAKKFTQYPMIDLNVKEIPADFPVRGYSNFVTLENKWTSSPVAFFTGGIRADGSYSDGTWAFDGSEWITLSKGGVPALEGASIIAYYNYRPSASGDSMIEYPVWMLLGGRKADGTLNRIVYISYNNGVNWSPGVRSLQLPDAIPPMAYCDNVVVDFKKSANLSDGWKRLSTPPRRVNSWVNGDIISWECPYIFLFGGYSPEGKLYTTLWRGVLNRMTFTPVI